MANDSASTVLKLILCCLGVDGAFQCLCKIYVKITSFPNVTIPILLILNYICCHQWADAYFRAYLHCTAEHVEPGPQPEGATGKLPATLNFQKHV